MRVRTREVGLAKLRSLGLFLVLLQPACSSPTPPSIPLVATVALSARVVAVGDSVAFSVTWSNRTAQPVELAWPIAYDVRLVAPDGTTEFRRTGKPSIDILTPEMIVLGNDSRTWNGYWTSTRGRGTYTVEAGRFVGGNGFVPIGPSRSFVAE